MTPDAYENMIQDKISVFFENAIDSDNDVEKL